MTEQGLWQEIRQYYYDKFGIAPELVDIAPVLDILRLCASGSSNKSIAEFLGETEMGIAEIIDTYLGFDGWSLDLSFSPLQLYKQLESKDEDTFKNNVVLKYGYLITHNLERMYKASVIVEKLERLFDEKWI